MALILRGKPPQDLNPRHNFLGSLSDLAATIRVGQDDGSHIVSRNEVWVLT